jgi:uncharacterized MnhB-related membrane protein
MPYVLILAGLLVCAVQAIRAKRLLSSALWLAGASALTALLLYLLGAPYVAVIELSVGAGLVTVLFVFAINIAGEEAIELHSMLPRPLSWALIIVAVLLLGWMILPGLLPLPPSGPQLSFHEILWSDRKLDILLQVVLIFSGVLGVLGLLSEGPGRKEKTV